MKLMHLSDLHLGKRVNEFPMLADQQYILTQILRIEEDEKPDAVLLAGDIWDKPVPGADAVALFDDFLVQLSEHGAAVFVIPGNHDSPERVAFGGRLMKHRRIYLARPYNGSLHPIPLQDSFGTVYFYLLPFLKPLHVRRFFPEEPVETTNDALRLALSQTAVRPDARNVLVAHQFITGAAGCESEELSIGGSDNVDAALFSDFDYVALGHIHNPQQIGRATVRYCGTPLKYSFSEAGHEKSVTIAELGEKGSVVIRTIPLHPLHDLREIRGAYDEVTDRRFYSSFDRYDYLHEPDSGALNARLRQLDGEKNTLAETERTLAFRFARNREALQNITDTGRELSEQEKRCSWVENLADTANGTLSGKEKITLETFIQMNFFERILGRANTRFMVMSGGQYELRRRVSAENNRSKSGLELNVLDHYNGSLRSVKTLSGGESFLASLSLALGLADEIQSAAGGIQLDTMFVDEGFGSLDEDTLDQAIKALLQLTESNRLVGIISHVSELKECIDKQIVVTKTRDGGSHAEILGE